MTASGAREDVVRSLARWSVAIRWAKWSRPLSKSSRPSMIAPSSGFSKAYPKMMLALGKNNTPMAFIIAERIAQTDPFKQISEYVGSGPIALREE